LQYAHKEIFKPFKNLENIRSAGLLILRQSIGADTVSNTRRSIFDLSYLLQRERFSRWLS